MAELNQIVFSYESAFADRDTASLSESLVALREGLPCVRERVTAMDAAGVHRVHGLAAFLEDDRPTAIEAFEAARFLNASHVFPEGFVVDEHPLRALYDGIMSEPPPTPREIPAPESGWIGVDGRTSVQAPMSRPFVFQRYDGAGNLVDTAWVPAGGALPSYPTGSAPPAPAHTPVVPPPAKSPSSWSLLAGLGALTYPNPTDVDAYGAVFVGAEFGFNERVAAVVRVGPSLASARLPGLEEEQRGLLALWSVRLGAAVKLADPEAVHPYIGGSAVGFLHAGPRIAPGGVVDAGVEFPFGRVGWRVAAEGGVVTPHLTEDPRPIQPLLMATSMLRIAL